MQLYIHDIAGSVVRPVKQLKGFERVILNAGEEKEVCFTVDEKMLRFLRADNTFEVNRENLRCLSEIAVKWKNVKYLNY